jgi:hypothetical protein
MQESADKLDIHLDRLVNAGIPGIDIMHGELKNLMLLAEKEYSDAVEVEEENDYSDAMESMDRKYAEGFMDALVMCYKMTYDISFATADYQAKYKGQE